MKKTNSKILLSLFSFLLFTATSCAPKITFFVTKPSELPVDQVENVTIGTFSEQFSQEIPAPPGLGHRQINSRSTLTPRINRLVSNRPSADLVRAIFLSGLSKSNRYRILNTAEGDIEISGIVPNRSETAIINAKVKYFEHTFNSSEEIFFTLLARKGANTLQEQLKLKAQKEVFTRMAEQARAGFKVKTPYKETIAAMEIEFDMVRQSTGEKVVPTQTLRSYFAKKWGGKETTSHLPTAFKDHITERYQSDLSMTEVLKKQAQALAANYTDPGEYLAQGGKLLRHQDVPMNSIDIQTRLSKEIIRRYLKKISPYTEETVLEIASGDDIAVNLIKGNAYELAINRLESIDRSEEDSFNLGLAYESIAEYNQAAKYYVEALDKDPGNALYRQSLKRVQ